MKEVLHHLGSKKTSRIMGQTTKLNWLDSRISEPSTAMLVYVYHRGKVTSCQVASYQEVAVVRGPKAPSPVTRRD